MTWRHHEAENSYFLLYFRVKVSPVFNSVIKTDLKTEVQMSQNCFPIDTVIVIVVRYVEVHAWLKYYYSLSCGGFPNSMLASHPTLLAVLKPFCLGTACSLAVSLIYKGLSGDIWSPSA